MLSLDLCNSVLTANRLVGAQCVDIIQ